MKLVVDTNILITYFWKNSETRKIITHGEDLELVAPEFALEEINKHKYGILKKTKISEEEFKITKIDLAVYIKFFQLKEYGKFLQKALEFSPDENDIDFFALALKLNCPLWSNDKKLKQQDKVKVYSTEELLGIIY